MSALPEVTPMNPTAVLLYAWHSKFAQREKRERVANNFLQHPSGRSLKCKVFIVEGPEEQYTKLLSGAKTCKT